MKHTIDRLQIARNTFLLTLSLFILSCGSSGTEESSNATDTVIDDYSARIDNLIKTTNPRFFNGVILITQGGETKYLKEQGYADMEQQIPISVTDKFRIMSNSKQITAVQLLKQVEQGRIDLQKPISTYLSDLPQGWADTVTVHQLLNMSSGISGIDEPLLFQPGKGYHYSNPGYGLLGRIIREVTGKSYAENTNAMFKELGMNNTYCYKLDGENPGLIPSYALREGAAEAVDFSRFGFTKERWSDFLPAGGIVSDARDLNTWDSLLHQSGLLDTDYYQQLVTSSNTGPHAVFDFDSIGYGYGVRIHDKHPVTHIGHGGRGFGFVSVKLYFPATNVDVIVWENIYHMDGFPNNADIIYHFENEIRKIVLSSSLAG